MPKAHPREFRDDVVAVARKDDATTSQLAKDFGISESFLLNWLRLADVEGGHRPGNMTAESVDLRDLRRRGHDYALKYLMKGFDLDRNAWIGLRIAFEREEG